MNGQYYAQEPIMNEQYYSQAPIMNEQYYAQEPIMDKRPIDKKNNNLYKLLIGIALATLYYILIFLPAEKIRKAKEEAAAAAAAKEKEKKDKDALLAAGTGTPSTPTGTPSTLADINNRLSKTPIMKGINNIYPANYFNFNCSNTINDYIKKISIHESGKINSIKFKCNSGVESNYYGVEMGYNHEIDLYGTSNDSIKVMAGSVINRIGNYGGIDGDEWIYKCNNNELIRGATGTAGSFLNSIGFKCA